MSSTPGDNSNRKLLLTKNLGNNYGRGYLVTVTITRKQRKEKKGKRLLGIVFNSYVMMEEKLDRSALASSKG